MPRRQRFDHGRNLQNLRVIPTSKSAPIEKISPSHQIYTFVENQVVLPIPAQSQGLETDVGLPSTSTPRPAPNQFKYRQNAFPAVNSKHPRPFRRRRNRRNRRPNMPYHQWYDSYNLNPVTEEFDDTIADASGPRVENAVPEEVKMENTTPEAKVENMPEAKEENYFEEVEVASVEGESKEEVLVGYRKTKRQYLSYKKKKKCFFRPKIFNLGERTFVNCLNMHDDVDVDIVSEAEYEYENDNVDKNELQEVPAKETGAGKVSAKNVEVPKTVLRKYKACIKSSNELTQGECLIQSSLDTWKSHLLGLEYLIEIQNEKKDAILKYHCVLCDCDVSFQGLPAIYVMNHVNDHKHVVRYLEKHFSAYGFKLVENNSYQVGALKKIAEEVNQKAGYYFMCVTTSAQFTNNKADFGKIIKSAYHPNEKNVKLDETLVEKALNFSLEEIQSVLSDVIDKVECLNDKLCSVEVAKTDGDKEAVNDCGEKSEIGKFRLKRKPLIGKARFSRPFSKAKGKRAFSTYLKSKYVKAAMQKKPLKGFSSHLNKESSQNKNSKTVPDEMDSSQVAGDLAEPSVGNASETDPVQTEDSQTSTGELVVEADVDSHSTECNLDQYAHKKVPLKATTTVHSKHCRKRILGKENCRSKLASKTSTKEELTSDVSENLNENYKSVSCSSDHTSRKVTKRHDKVASRSTQKKSSPHRHLAAHKVSKDLKHSSSHHKITSKKNVEDPSLKQIKVAKDSPSEWRPIATTKSLAKSPTSGASSLPKSSLRKNVKKCSKSPVKRIKSPLRLVKEPSKNSGTRHSRSPVGRRSKSPIWKPTFQSGLQGTRSPFRRKSRSPLWKPSRSPIRRKSRSPRRRYSRSPVRHRSRTPIRRQSKSPKRRYSRSPRRRHSRSPVRHHSRSPMRRRSRSPIKRRSRSPVKRRSRSPMKRRSRSPVKRRSRSPVKRRSRSPVKRRSRSPVKRRSRSPVKRRSRSPARRYSRSPVRQYSRSPIRKHSRSPFRRYSRSPIKRRSRSPMHTLSKSPSKYRSSRESISPNRRQGRFNSPSHVYSYNKLSDSTKSEFSKIRETCKILNEIKGGRSEYKSHQYSSSSAHGISDLDPVSDEDESLYFSDKLQADVVSSSSTKMVLAKLLQKFSMADVKPSDPAVNKLMQFMESHSSEIQELMGSHSKSGSTNVSKIDTDAIGRNLLLQQYLLSNLAGFNQERALAATAVASNLPSNFPQQSFLQTLPGFGLNIPPNVAPNIPPNVASNIPTNVAPNIPTNMAHNIPNNVPSGIPTNMPPPNVSQPVQRFFPPNINVPPPQIFHQPNQHQPRQSFPPKPNVPPEVMFKDLKATVNKLFGANEVVMKQEKIKPQVPGYVTEPDPEKWDLNHPDTQKFNSSIASKNMFQPLGKSIDFGGMHKNMVREEIPIFNNNSNNNPGQFFSGRGGMNRSQMQNVPIPPPDAKVSFCDVPHGSKGNLFPVVNGPNFGLDPRACGGVSDVKLSLAQRLASVLVKFGMIDVPAPLLQEMLMKIGAFSSSPRQDINESEIISILKRLGYLS